MRLSSWLKLAEISVGAAFLAAVFLAWKADRRDKARLQAQLAASQRIIVDLTAQQNARSAQLAKTLAQLSAKKRAVQTPEQALQNLPAVLALPAPIHSAEVPPKAPPDASKSPGPPSAPAPAVIPLEDLKPLYDFASDCNACKAKLATAQADLADEKSKSQALERERDTALRAAKGGSIWRRIGRAAKWFALGAAAGVVAAKSAP